MVTAAGAGVADDDEASAEAVVDDAGAVDCMVLPLPRVLAPAERLRIADPFRRADPLRVVPER